MAEDDSGDERRVSNVVVLDDDGDDDDGSTISSGSEDDEQVEIKGEYPVVPTEYPVAHSDEEYDEDALSEVTRNIQLGQIRFPIGLNNPGATPAPVAPAIPVRKKINIVLPPGYVSPVAPAPAVVAPAPAVVAPAPAVVAPAPAVVAPVRKITIRKPTVPSIVPSLPKVDVPSAVTIQPASSPAIVVPHVPQQRKIVIRAPIQIPSTAAPAAAPAEVPCACMGREPPKESIFFQKPELKAPAGSLPK
jgi:hypothetical protein